VARVLWVSTETPDRDGQGGQRRQYHQIRALIGRGHDITVVVPRSAQDDRTIRRLTTVRRPRIVIRGTLVRLWYERLLRVVSDPAWDAVVVAHHESWWLLPPPERMAAPVLLDVHNVMSHWHREAGRDEEARVMVEQEAEAVRAATVVTTCSDVERRRLVALHPWSADKVFVAPLGIDPDEWPEKDFDRGRPIVALFGTWSWRPNTLGLEWFLHEVWPLVRRANPDALAWVAGTGGDEIADWPEGARYLGRVGDLAAFAAAATVVAVPVWEGVGASVKFAEALASGASVIATPDGANAFDDPPAFVATRPEEWADWITERLRRRADEHAPADARAFALSQCTWDRAVEPIDRWLRERDGTASR
jgi:glycosyltransferase involved in cell wall biosynthesis